MNKKMHGSYYPTASSSKPSFRKSEDLNGAIVIEGGVLKFLASVLMIRIKSRDLEIELADINRVEAMNLNGLMPFGVCLFMNDGTEYMFGHIRNKKLAEFITSAIKENKDDNLSSL